MGRVDEIISDLREQEHGYSALARYTALFEPRQFKFTSAFSERNLALIQKELDSMSTDDPVDVIERAFRSRERFKNPAIWALYWCLVDSMHQVMKGYRKGALEPDLNYHLLTQLETAADRFKMGTDEEGRVQQDCLVVGTHLASDGYEGRTGADFGLIIEIFEDGVSKYYPTLIQAKRARRVKKNINQAAEDTTQLDKLLQHGIGCYLFYNQFGRRYAPPTCVSALLASFYRDAGNLVHTLDFAVDFAVHLALQVPSLATWTTRQCSSGEEALAMIFNPAIPDNNPRELFVCILDRHGIEPKRALEIKTNWQGVVRAVTLEHESAQRARSGLG